jgi:hypothetical protein
MSIVSLILFDVTYALPSGTWHVMPAMLLEHDQEIGEQNSGLKDVPKSRAAKVMMEDDIVEVGAAAGVNQEDTRTTVKEAMKHNKKEDDSLSLMGGHGGAVDSTSGVDGAVQVTEGAPMSLRNGGGYMLLSLKSRDTTSRGVVKEVLVSGSY